MILLAAVLAAHMSGGAQARDVRPQVGVVFTIPENHPYALPFLRNLRSLESKTAEKLAAVLQSRYRFLRFTAGEGPRHTLYFLLESRASGTRNDPLRDLWLYAALDERPLAGAPVAWIVREAGSDFLLIGDLDSFSGSVAQALEKIGTVPPPPNLVTCCFRSIAIGTRAHKPAQTAYWLMPFAIAELGADPLLTRFTVASVKPYVTAVVELPEALAYAVGEYAGKTVTHVMSDEEALKRQGPLDATRVVISEYSIATAPQVTKPAGTARPAGTGRPRKP